VRRQFLLETDGAVMPFALDRSMFARSANNCYVGCDDCYAETKKALSHGQGQIKQNRGIRNSALRASCSLVSYK